MNVKGTALIVLPAFIEDKFGREGLEKWMSALDGETAAVYKNGIKINQWYPLKTMYLEPTAIMCELFYGNDTKGAWEIGNYSAEYALKGVYKAFVKLTSVSFFIKRASLLMTTYYKPSTMRVAEENNNGIVLQMTEFPESHELIETRIAGWVHRAMEIHGCQEVTVETRSSLAKNDPCTEFVVNWK